MKKRMYDVLDTATLVYMGPFQFRTDGEAMRWFQDQATTDTAIAAHPEHYSLYYIGDHDDSKGDLLPADKICLATAEEVVALAQNVPPKLKEVN